MRFVGAADWEQAATKAISSIHNLERRLLHKPVLECNLLSSVSKPDRRQAMPTISAKFCCLSCSVRHAPPSAAGCQGGGQHPQRESPLAA